MSPDTSATPSALPRSTAQLRIAGVLIVVSALALAIKQVFGLVLEYQTLYAPADGNGFADLLPLFVLVALEAGPLIVAFILIAVWVRRPLLSVVFAILAIAIPVGYVVEPTEAGSAFDLAHVSFGVLAGIVVLVSGVFARRVGVLFLGAMLLFEFGVLSSVFHLLDESTLWGDAAAGIVLGLVYGAFGIALVIWSLARTTSKATE